MGLRFWAQAPSCVQDLNHWHSDAKSQRIIYNLKFFLPATTYRCRTTGQGSRGGPGRCICVCAYLEAAVTVWKGADWQRSVVGGFCFWGKSKALALKLSWDLHTPKAEVGHYHKTPLNPLCSHDMQGSERTNSDSSQLPTLAQLFFFLGMHLNFVPSETQIMYLLFNGVYSLSCFQYLQITHMLL